MRAWLLILDGEEGLAREVQSISAFRGPRQASINRLEVETVAVNDLTDGDMLVSAKESGTLALRLLMREYGAQWQFSLAALEFEFEEIHGEVEGRSSDLVFAMLTFFDVVRGPDISVPPFSDKSYAATGALDKYGTVTSVAGVAAKLDAALRCGMPRGGFFFYPRDDELQLDEAARSRARKAGVMLRPVRRLDEALASFGIDIEGWWSGSPYRGLAAFSPQHSRIYFGREREIDALKSMLDTRADTGRPGALVVGSSGSGKTSLVLAGLVSALPAQDDEGREWRHAIWRPRQALPTDSRDVSEADLARSILADWSRRSQGDEPAQNGFEGLGLVGPVEHLGDLLIALDRIDRSRYGLVWVVDQLEEILTLPQYGKAVRATLGEFLLALQKRGVWIIGTLRVESRARLFGEGGPAAGEADSDSLPYAELFGPGHEGVLMLEHMAAESLRQVITRPADLAGFRFEVGDDGTRLEDIIYTEALNTSNALPLLEYALQRLFLSAEGETASSQSDDARPEMTIAAYRRFGGLKGAIGSVAGEAFSALAPDIRSRLPTLLYALAKPSDDGGDTSLPAELSRWPAGSLERSLVNALVEDARVLVISQEGADRQIQVRVAHEALFSNWPEAAAILDESRETRLSLANWNQRAAQWDRERKRTGWLTGADERAIRASQRQLGSGAPGYPVLEQLVAESAKRRRRQQFASSLGACVLVAAAFGAYKFIEGRGDARVDLAKAATAKRDAGIRYLQTARGLRTEGQYVDQEAVYQNLVAGEFLAPSASAEHDLGDSLAGRRMLSKVLRVDLRPTAIAMSADESRLVYGDTQGALHLVSLTPSVAEIATAKLAKGSVKDLASANGDRAFVMLDSEGRIQVFDKSTLKSTASLPPSEPKPLGMAMSHDGLRLALSLEDGSVRIVSADTLTTLAQSPETRKIDHASANGVETKTSIGVLGAGGVTGAIVFSADDTMLAVAGAEGNVRMMRSSNLAVSGSITSASGRPIYALAFRPDGRELAAVGEDKTVAVSSTSPLRALRQSTKTAGDTILHVAYAGDGASLVTAAYDGKTVLWDATTLTPIDEPLADGQGVIDGFWPMRHGAALLTASEDRMVRLYHFGGSSFEVPASLRKPGLTTRAVASSPDGALLAAGSDEGHLAIWGRDGHDVCAAGPQHDAAIDSIAFGPKISADGQPSAFLVATGSDDTTVRLWNSQTCEPIGKPLKAHTGFVTAVAFSPDGSQLASGSYDNKVRLFDRRPGTTSYAVRSAAIVTSHNAIFTLGYSPDGAMLAAAGGDKVLRFIRAADGSEAAPPIQHPGPVTAIAFKAGNAIVATASGDGRLRLFDMASGKQIGEPLKDEEKGEILSIAMDKAGRHLFSGAQSGRVVSWALSEATPVGTILHGKGAPAYGLTLTPDGALIAMATGASLQIAPGPETWRAEACNKLWRKPTADHFEALGPEKPC